MPPLYLRFWNLIESRSKRDKFGYCWLIAVMLKKLFAEFHGLVRGNHYKPISNLELDLPEIWLSSYRVAKRRQDSPILQPTDKPADPGKRTGNAIEEYAFGYTEESSTGDWHLISKPILVNGGWSTIHEGHYIRGIWNEGRRGVTNLETEAEFIRYARNMQVSDLQEITRIPGRSLNLAGPWSENYFHWLLQYLPIIKNADRHVSLDTFDNFIVAEPARSFQLESLKRCGINDNRIVEISRRSLVCLDELYISPISYSNMVFNSSTIDFLRSLADRWPTKKAGFGLYFDRPAPNQRRAVNSKDVLEVLESFNIQVVNCGNMTFSDQVILSSSASFICGIHGASLANFVFSKPGIGVLELVPRNYQLLFFLSLSTSCQHDYSRLLGCEPGPLPGQLPLQDADIIIPIKGLRRALETAYKRHPWI